MTLKKRQSKKQTKSAAKPNVQKIAETFEAEFNKTMKLVPLPDGSVAYKNFIVKENKKGIWQILSKTTLDPHGEFNLKSCALIGAKALDRLDFNGFNEVKQLDNKYWSNYTTVQVCQHHIKKIKEFDRYMIMLNKLEHSTWLADIYKEEISKRFHWSFV